ncbi:MAG: hypothetical protein F4191_08785 [Rhodothermaceae bacterium]|nr:hypothetical protein [Rhodothermaceae bacterium]
MGIEGGCARAGAGDAYGGRIHGMGGVGTGAGGSSHGGNDGAGASIVGTGAVDVRSADNSGCGAGRGGCVSDGGGVGLWDSVEGRDGPLDCGRDADVTGASVPAGRRVPSRGPGQLLRLWTHARTGNARRERTRYASILAGRKISGNGIKVLQRKNVSLGEKEQAAPRNETDR